MVADVVQDPGQLVVGPQEPLPQLLEVLVVLVDHKLVVVQLVVVLEWVEVHVPGVEVGIMEEGVGVARVEAEAPVTAQGQFLQTLKEPTMVTATLR